MFFKNRFRSLGIWAASAAFFGMQFIAPTHAFSQAVIPGEKTLESKVLSSEQELNEIRENIELSAAKKAELNQEISALEKDRANLNRQLIDTATRSRSLEEGIERTSSRLSDLRTEEEEARQLMLDKRSILIEVIAALQRMGHKPPPALIVRPDDALASVRSAILMGAVVPEIREQTQILVSELEKLTNIRKEIETSRNSLLADLNNLAEEEERLSLLLNQKRELSNNARQELSAQTALAVELAGKARSLNSLIGELQLNLESVRKAREQAKQAEERRLALEKENAERNQTSANNQNTNQSNFADTSRIAPAISFASAQGLLPKPVVGVEIASFGKKNTEGELAKGVSIATRAEVRVQAPADGWVIYSGPFRSYGQLIILDAGGGYHIVMSGMERLNVELGQFVLTGEPIAIMGKTRIASTGNIDVGLNKPILYVEFRKDGESVDPSPWWAASILKESNG